MNLQTNLQGRLRNTSLSPPHGLQAVFEAVVNSIHSIEERKGLKGKGKISLNIERTPQMSYDPATAQQKDIIGFTIEDNGIGFNEENMDSFKTLDSDHKMAKGCRGIGRLLWLKAFRNVKINSVFKNTKGEFQHREITFDAKNGIKSKPTVKSKDSILKTQVSLNKFEEKYRKCTKKRIDAIASSLLEHCLWYFIRPEGVPQITVQEEGRVINLNDLFTKYQHEASKKEKIKINEAVFQLTHIKFRSSFQKNHGISLCANSRLVQGEVVKKGELPGLHGKISDEKGDFYYNCYVSSKYLDEKVRGERTSFDILEKKTEDFFDDISLQDIREKVLERSKEYLSKHLHNSITAGKKRIEKFVAEKAPKYRPIIGYIDNEKLAVDPAINNKKLDLYLHEQLAEVEREMMEQGHEIMENFGDDIDDYKARLGDYLKKAEDLKKSDLASYISHRRVIIDLLEKHTQRTESGKYAREEVVHELIMPMRKDSNHLTSEANLWLIDERLAFHNYLASDKPLSSMPITGSKSGKEPDIFALNIYDEPLLVSDTVPPKPLASITVIEIKRPMRNDAGEGEGKNPILQALDYLKKVREGKVKTENGRPIPNSDHIPGFCYIICDLTESMRTLCDDHDLIETHDKSGYFGFHKKRGAYVEVISYDRLVTAASERNRAFFDKLGLPAN